MHAKVNALFIISTYTVEFAFLEYYYILLPLCNTEHTAGFLVSPFVLVENSD